MSAGDEYFEDLLKVNLQYSGDRNTAENVFYASCLGAHGATLTDLNDLASSIFTLAGTYIMEAVQEGIALVAVKVADWTSNLGLTGEHTGSTAGSLTGDPLTAQVTGLINYQTNERYRGGRGRMYIPPPDVASVETDLAWSSSYVTSRDSGMTAFFDGVDELSIGDDLLTVVLYHRGTDTVPQGFEAVIGVTCSPVPGTQRRRVRRVGHLR